MCRYSTDTFPVDGVPCVAMNGPTVSFLTRRLVIAVFAAAPLLVSACQSKPAAPPPAPAVSPDTWATVDGTAITRDQVEKEFRRVRQETGALPDEEALIAKMSVLEDLIVEHILLSRAPRLA